MQFLQPFRHHIIDGFIDADIVAQINREWPDEWFKESGKGQNKWSTSRLPETAAQVAAGIDIGMVETATGINGLFPDPQLFGAGLHCIPRGGFLKMHIDFNRHPKGWSRRVNLLIYLNEHWESEWGGNLRLGLEKPKEIEPLGGRCVIFETNNRSWHGHPEPLACPPDVQRRSLALYYYTHARPKGRSHTTIYDKSA